MKRARLNHMMAFPGIALALVLVGCGGGGGDEVADMTPMPPAPPDPGEVTGTFALAAGDQVALRALRGLDDNGEMATLQIAAGATEERADVEFTCNSDYPCTVTLENNLNVILMTWSTMAGRGDDGMLEMASVMAETPEPDTFAELNSGDTPAIRSDVVGVGPDSNKVPPTFTLTELIGMGIGGPGVLNADKAGLRSDFQANGGALAGHAYDDDEDAVTFAIADPGDPPDLRMGTTITGEMDAIDPTDDMAPAPDGWVMKTLFRDWGDTAGDGDGGFETGAIVVKNLGEGTPYPFDRKLFRKYVNDAAQDMFRLIVRADGKEPGVTTLGTSVSIGREVKVKVSDEDVTISAATATQWANMVFDSESLVPAQDQDLEVNTSETFTGSYFGAPGKFQCIADINMDCGLARNDDDTVGVADTDVATMGIQGAARWTFTPDPDAMITVPDQDWIAYGAWLTTPDDPPGDHRLGVFFNGMDPWTAAADSLDATNAAGLRGSATYSGGATGVYVDGAASGLFTARAMFTADFDKASNGVDNTAVDYMISGRIDNFRGTDGTYLGDDTQESPNDPTAGENDWVVELGAKELAATGFIEKGRTTGSADGVSWDGRWNGQLFGPTDADGDPTVPSGVAGRFWAETDDPDENDAGVASVTAVVGTFGATKDD